MSEDVAGVGRIRLQVQLTLLMTPRSYAGGSNVITRVLKGGRARPKWQSGEVREGLLLLLAWELEEAARSHALRGASTSWKR